ncbi:MAG: hypothetical protein LBU77_01525 [Clostridiales bacterium]|jgi:hypothetical protein|nr:hypothetical protein [Clostridiales bacterium]
MKKLKGSLFAFLAASVMILTGFTAYAATTHVKTQQELEAAVKTAVEATEIIIDNDIELASPITLDNGKNITIKSAEGVEATLLATHQRHFSSNAASAVLTLENITLAGDWKYNHGGIAVTNGTLNVKDGALITTGWSSYGGAINASNATVNIAGGEISGNKANGNGGGIYAANNSIINITGGVIGGNTALAGGGVYSASNSTVTVSGAVISNNTATSASSGGGGIFSQSLAALTVSNVAFEGNTASQAYWMKADTTDMATYNAHISGIVRLSNPPKGNANFEYAYNNYDIGYSGGLTENPILPFYTVKFMDGETLLQEPQLVAEGSAATAPAVLPEHENFVFVGWDADFDCVMGDLTVNAVYEAVFSADFEGEGGARIYNVTGEKLKGSAILAVYKKDGSLALVKAADFEIEADGVCDIEFGVQMSDYPQLGEGYTAKMFFWSDAYLPLTAPVDRA